MAIKLKKDVININDELNRELSVYGFQIELPDDNKKADQKDKKNDQKDNKKTTKKK